jgi:hypothetical protein
MEDHVATLQQELDAAIASLRAVQERDLPEAMSLAGLDSYTLKGGRKVAVKTTIIASPTKDQQPQMLAWLDENEHGDLIKHEVKVSFGKGEDTRAERFMDWVSEHLPKQKTDTKRFVHPQTLSAFVREQMAKHVDLPDEFGVLILKKSVVNRPKEGPEF